MRQPSEQEWSLTPATPGGDILRLVTKAHPWQPVEVGAVRAGYHIVQRTDLTNGWHCSRISVSNVRKGDTGLDQALREGLLLLG